MKKILTNLYCTVLTGKRQELCRCGICTEKRKCSIFYRIADNQTLKRTITTAFLPGDYMITVRYRGAGRDRIFQIAQALRRVYEDKRSLMIFAAAEEKSCIRILLNHAEEVDAVDILEAVWNLPDYTMGKLTRIDTEKNLESCAESMGKNRKKRVLLSELVTRMSDGWKKQ